MPVKGVHPLLNKASVDVVKSLPDFTPGYQDCKPVPVWYSVPIIFQLTDNEVFFEKLFKRIF